MHFSKNEGRNARFDIKSKKPFRKIRFYYKLCKEHFNTFKNAGVSRLPIQQQINVNFGTIIEDCKLDEEDSTIDYVSEENMSMDCRAVGEDDFNDTSDRRSIASHMISSERPVTNITSNKSELGSNMQLVLYQPRGVTLVGEVHSSKE